MGGYAGLWGSHGLFGVQGLGKSYGLGYFSEACGGVGTCESWWDLLGLWGGYGD